MFAKSGEFDLSAIMTPMHVVLFEPDIPGNTGNVGRTCLATGSTLHLVGPLGFSLDDRYVRRSGLDYWSKVKVERHAGWETFIATLAPRAGLFFFSKKAEQPFWNACFDADSYLVFGCETRGLPSWFAERYSERFYQIPMAQDSVRSLNLATAVGVVVYEALRQTQHLSPHASGHRS